MYEAFYGFDCAPFSNIPDPEFLYLSPQHKRAVSILEYALVTRSGFCVITGDVGAGKTTLLRSVLQRVDSDVEVGLVSNTQCDSFEEFLSWILLAFGLQPQGKSKVELYDEFVRYLIDQHDQGHPVTLVVDEAQHLGYTYLEQLRMLSNVNTEKGLLLQTILIGQPELWDLLRSPDLEQFAQRISYDYFLEPLQNEESVEQYIKYRLEKAGGNTDIFLAETFEVIWLATKGVPRLINLFCDNALLYGYAEESTQIDLNLANQVLEDKQNSFVPIGDKQPSRRTSKNMISDNPSTRGISAQQNPKSLTVKKLNQTPSSTADLRSLSTIERAAKRLNQD